LAEPVRARRLTQDEGRKLQQLVRRGKHDSVRVRRALIIMAFASGTPVPAIANLIAGHEDTVRDVIHSFNEIGLRALDLQWAGGRPRPASCRNTCAGATPTPAIPTSWPPNAANEPASVVNVINGGGGLGPRPPNRQSR
jgi:hypothetical protein